MVMSLIWSEEGKEWEITLNKVVIQDKVTSQFLSVRLVFKCLYTECYR